MTLKTGIRAMTIISALAVLLFYLTGMEFAAITCLGFVFVGDKLIRE